MISLHVDVRIDPAHRDDFRAAITDQARATMRDEPGCLLFDVIVDQSDPDHFMFYEVYVDAAAFEAHKAAPHFADWARARGAYVVEQHNTFGDQVIALPGYTAPDPTTHPTR